MIEKIFRGIYNIIRLAIIKIRCGKRVEIPLLQPMRIRSELLIQSKIEKVVIGKHLKLETDSKIRVINGGKLTIGDNCFINCNSYITVLGNTNIGNHCMIGPGVMIFDHDHDYKAPGGIRAGKRIVGEIEIGNNVWIGANTIILKGAKIGDDSVIAAGSIVHGSIPEHTLFIQKRRSEYKVIETIGEKND